MLDSCARLHLGPGQRLGSYFGCGVLGVLLGAALVVVLAGVEAAGVTARAAVIAVVAPQLGFLLAVKGVQVVTGQERIVMYEQALAALLVTAGALRMCGEPVGVGVELAMAGILAFLSVARVGCLRVGCCHGRPHRRGIRYGAAHAAAGFPRELVGVRLFPIQLCEAAAAGLITALAAVWIARPHMGGEVAARALGLYGVCRFGLELFRGDAARPVLCGLSEAQWTAVGLSWALWWVAAQRGYAGAALYGAAALVLSLAAAGVAAAWRRWPLSRWALSQAWRLAELAGALSQLAGAAGRGAAGGAGAIAVVELSAGLRLSGDLAAGHLTLSGPGLGEAGAQQVARQAALLLQRAGGRVQAGRTAGVYHVLLAPPE